MYVYVYVDMDYELNYFWGMKCECFNENLKWIIRSMNHLIEIKSTKTTPNNNNNNLRIVFTYTTILL